MKKIYGYDNHFKKSYKSINDINPTLDITIKD